MATKTREENREELIEELRQERAAARARFGDRNVTDVLLKARTRLRMLSDMCAGKAEEDDFSEMSSDAWSGLSDTLDDVWREIAMLEDALPADVHNWRPGQDPDRA
jgi:hypothetical protein